MEDSKIHTTPYLSIYSFECKVSFKAINRDFELKTRYSNDTFNTRYSNDISTTLIVHTFLNAGSCLIYSRIFFDIFFTSLYAMAGSFACLFWSVRTFIHLLFYVLPLLCVVVVVVDDV